MDRYSERHSRVQYIMWPVLAS